MHAVTGRVGLHVGYTVFLTFMSVSGFPSFVEEMRVFTRERGAGYYRVLPYAAANTAASLPFLAGIAASCMALISLLAGLNITGGRLPFAVLNLTLALATAEAMVMAIAALVPHPLPGIALAASIMGVFMPICGYFISLNDLPTIFWRYPMHYVSFYSFTAHAAVLNEFKATQGWACPGSLAEGGLSAGKAARSCELAGEEVIEILQFGLGRSKWLDMLVLVAMTAAYRTIFFALLKVREARLL